MITPTVCAAFPFLVIRWPGLFLYGGFRWIPVLAESALIRPGFPAFTLPTLAGP